MKVSQKCLNMIRHHEGVRTRPYQCPALIWTVGVGHVIDQSHIRVKFYERKNLPIPSGWNRQLSMEEVNKILADDLTKFERGVLRMCPVVTQSQFDALVSFAFNVGLGNLQRSSIRMRHNRKDYEGAADAFMMWTKAGGRILNGLVKRRKDERALYVTP